MRIDPYATPAAAPMLARPTAAIIRRRRNAARKQAQKLHYKMADLVGEASRQFERLMAEYNALQVEDAVLTEALTGGLREPAE